MSEKDNPAERLYQILTKMVNESGGSVSDVLNKAIGTARRDDSELFEDALEFHNLFRDVVRRLTSIEGIDEELYINPILSLRRAIPLTSLSSAWDNFKTYVDAADMRSLKHAAFELSRHPLPDAIPFNTLATFENELNRLYDRVDESNLPPELRRLILERLYDIIKAARLYSVRGAEPLRRALLLNAGSLVTNWQLFQEYEQREEVQEYKNAFEKLIKIIPVAADSTTLLSAGWQAVKALLSSGGS